MNALKPVSFRKEREHLPRLSKPYVPGRHDRRYWTEAEHEVLRRHFPDGGAAACLVHLPPHRTTTTVYQQAHKLGLRSNNPGGGPKTRLDIPDDVDERIRAAWPDLQGRGAVSGLADRLGVPRWWLTKRATKLGLTVVHRKEPQWTAAEDRLMHAVPLHSPDVAARIFREHGFSRTPTAIVVRAKRLKLSRRTHSCLSGTQAARILGMDNKTVTQWCVLGELKARRRGTKRLPQQGGDVWDIEAGELRAFVIDNLARLDIRKVDKFAFVDLLVGDGTARPPEEAP